jgi:hypothetical protein
MADIFKKGDRVRLTLDAEVVLASNNGHSLVLTFDTTLGKHAGAMAVLREHGQFRSIITEEVVSIHRPEDTADDKV